MKYFLYFGRNIAFVNHAPISIFKDIRITSHNRVTYTNQTPTLENYSRKRIPVSPYFVGSWLKDTTQKMSIPIINLGKDSSRV